MARNPAQAERYRLLRCCWVDLYFRSFRLARILAGAIGHRHLPVGVIRIKRFHGVDHPLTKSGFDQTPLPRPDIEMDAKKKLRSQSPCVVSTWPSTGSP